MLSSAIPTGARLRGPLLSSTCATAAPLELSSSALLMTRLHLVGTLWTCRNPGDQRSSHGRQDHRQCHARSGGNTEQQRAPVGPRGACAMKVFDATPGATRTAELTDAASPWYRRPGILIAAAALIAGVGIVVSGPREPGTAPGGTTGTSTPWSVSFSLVSTDIWEPPPAPPAPAPPAPEPPAPEPPPVAYVPAPTREWVPPPPPPPPPPPQLVLRYDDPCDGLCVDYQ